MNMIFFNVQAAMKSAQAAQERETQVLADFAKAIGGVTPEHVRLVLESQGLTVAALEFQLSREHDYGPMLRSMWLAWQSPAGERAKREQATRQIPTVPERLLDSGATAALARCSEPVRRLAAEYDPHTMGARLLLGPTRVGKSLCLAQSALRLTLAGRAGIRWVSASRLIQEARGHRYGAGLCGEVRDAIAADWLVVDEIGWEQGDHSALLDVLSARYDLGRVTSATSGMRVEDFRARYGEAVERRIVESDRSGRGKTTDWHQVKGK